MPPYAETSSTRVYYAHCLNDCGFFCCVLHIGLVTMNLTYNRHFFPAHKSPL